MAGGKRPIATDPSTWPRFEFKSGLGGFKWDGMKLEGDPSNMPTTKLRYLINGRLVDGVITDRAGFEDYDASPMGSSDKCVIAINSVDTTVSRLFWSKLGCPNALNGASFEFYDPENEPQRQTYAIYPYQVDFEPMIGRYGDEVYLGVQSKLIRSRQPPAEFGVAVESGRVEDTLIYDFGSPFTINFIEEYDGSLYIGLAAAVGTSKIMRWNGKTLFTELTGIGIPTAAATFREFLVVGFTAASNHIRYRNQAGTWTTVAAGAGTVSAHRSCDAMLSWHDNLYIATGSTTLFKWTGPGGTLLAANTIALSTHKAVAEFFDNLYYLYDTAAAAIVGKYDGTTFTNAEKNLTTQFPNDTISGGMASYKGQLYVGMDNSVVFASPGIITSSTWLGTPSVAPTPGHKVTNLKVI